MELRPSIIVNLPRAGKDSRTGSTQRSARQLQSKENYGGTANMAIDALEAGPLYRNFGSLMFPVDRLSLTGILFANLSNRYHERV